MSRTSTSEPKAPRALRFGDAGGVPNNPNLPVLIYPGAVPGDASAIADRFRANGWGGTWAWTVFDYHHYHPASHEVLGVASGRAELMLGGPEGTIVEVSAGDVVVLPAGTGHRRVTSSPDFQVVGAYPHGQEDPEIVHAPDGRRADHLARIARTPLPESDPVSGGPGPLLSAWTAS